LRINIKIFFIRTRRQLWHLFWSISLSSGSLYCVCLCFIILLRPLPGIFYQFEMLIFTMKILVYRIGLHSWCTSSCWLALLQFKQIRPFVVCSTIAANCFQFMFLWVNNSNIFQLYFIIFSLVWPCTSCSSFLPYLFWSWMNVSNTLLYYQFSILIEFLIFSSNSKSKCAQSRWCAFINSISDWSLPGCSLLCDYCWIAHFHVHHCVSPFK